MAILELMQINLLSPMVLAFGLGIIATLVHSDLKLPDELYTTLSIYLLLAIGLKGGIALAQTSLAAFWAPALATLLLGLIIPLVAYAIARR
ncbi:MAG: sodium-dependent bicarbonate transport family permease, partial [Chloroflexus sp.]|nr:sodium-dependent bicarbonate transport family permease [Chloroflexus sp.]